MDSARKKEVTRLLKRGLNHYGLGDLDAAIQSWERARALDPENQAVHDYLETAYEEAGRDPCPQVAVDPMDDEATPRSMDQVFEVEAEIEEESEPDRLIAQALEHYQSGDLDTAWGLLQEVKRLDPSRLDLKGYLQLVRTERAQQWAKQIGDQGRTLELNVTTQEMMRLNLAPDEGFLLSQVDGRTSITDLMNVSHVDRVRALEILARLIRENIVR